jgi:hypothetical protein
MVMRQALAQGNGRPPMRSPDSTADQASVVGRIVLIGERGGNGPGP